MVYGRSAVFIGNCIQPTRTQEIFGEIQNYLRAHGYERTTEQCHQKLKKLRVQFLKVRDALRKSGSSSDIKDKLHWYDAVDKIIGLKPANLMFWSRVWEQRLTTLQRTLDWRAH